MDLQFRSFKCQANKGTEGSAGQGQNESTAQAFYECGSSTKINCIVNGPMQKSQGADMTSADSC